MLDGRLSVVVVLPRVAVAEIESTNEQSMQQYVWTSTMMMMRERRARHQSPRQTKTTWTVSVCLADRTIVGC